MAAEQVGGSGSDAGAATSPAATGLATLHQLETGRLEAGRPGTGGSRTLTSEIGSSETGERCRARIVLDRVADKWSLFVMASLARGEQRFTELKRNVDGVSQRMLTVTLRQLERDGIVTRTIYSAMPPNIAYCLTPLGRTLWEAAAPLVAWAAAHLDEIETAQHAYDACHAPASEHEDDASHAPAAP